jgi:hypothetical protein
MTRTLLLVGAFVVVLVGCASGEEPVTCPPVSIGGGVLACCIPSGDGGSVCDPIDSGSCIPTPGTDVCYDFPLDAPADANGDAPADAPACAPVTACDGG